MDSDKVSIAVSNQVRGCHTSKIETDAADTGVSARKAKLDNPVREATRAIVYGCCEVRADARKLDGGEVR